MYWPAMGLGDRKNLSPLTALVSPEPSLVSPAPVKLSVQPKAKATTPVRTATRNGGRFDAEMSRFSRSELLRKFRPTLSITPHAAERNVSPGRP